MPDCAWLHAWLCKTIYWPIRTGISSENATEANAIHHRGIYWPIGNWYMLRECYWGKYHTLQRLHTHSIHSPPVGLCTVCKTYCNLCVLLCACVPACTSKVSWCAWCARAFFCCVPNSFMAQGQTQAAFFIHLLQTRCQDLIIKQIGHLEMDTTANGCDLLILSALSTCFKYNMGDLAWGCAWCVQVQLCLQDYMHARISALVGIGCLL